MLVIPAKTNNELMKNVLTPYVNKNIKIKSNLGRNKYETYNAKIIKLYNQVFLVEKEDKTIKSFSYADIITKTVKILDF